MTRDTLQVLLRRLAQGSEGPDDLARARVLLLGDDRLPVALREDALQVDVADDALALLAVLGDDGPVGVSLAGGWRAEALPESDVADDVMAALGIGAQPPVAAAVRTAAGPVPRVEVLPDGWSDVAVPLRDGLRTAAMGVDVAADVIVAIGGVALPLSAAVRAEAGAVEVVRPVLDAVGLTEATLDLRAAVLAMAGPVNVADAVCEQVESRSLSALLDGELTGDERAVALAKLKADPSLGRDMTAWASLGAHVRAAVAAEAGEVQLWCGVGIAVGVADPEHVEGWDGALLAGAVRAAAGDVDVRDAVLGQIHGRQVSVTTPPAVPTPANTTGGGWWLQTLSMLAAAALVAVLVYRPGATVPGAPPPMLFASAGEVTIEDLSYADNVTVQVIQADDDAPLILWVEEEVTL